MRVLITGGFGYLGMALARHLAAHHDVLITGRRPRPACAKQVGVLLRELRIHSCATDGSEWPHEWVREAEAIVHLAGGGASGGNLGQATAALRDNLDSAAHIADIAPMGCRLVLASSIYVYGVGNRPFRETDTPAPDTLYGQLKAVAEAVWRQHGGVALRFAHIYGAGSGIDFDRSGVTERLAWAAAGGSPFRMHGDGSQQIDLVHIDDACEAVALALRTKKLPDALNIGGGNPVSVADLARVFGVQPHVDSCLVLPSNRALDIGLARAWLGWSPRVALADGAQGLVDVMGGRRHPTTIAEV